MITPLNTCVCKLFTNCLSNNCGLRIAVCNYVLLGLLLSFNVHKFRDNSLLKLPYI